MSEQVRKMFASIASDYDRVNTVLSFGIHHWWRYQTVKSSAAKNGDHVLDCATGTGDLALTFKKKVGVEGYVMGTDFCAEMLGPAPIKARERNLDVDFEVADAMSLPYDSNKFDIASISFGIRNVDEPATALKEMARVVKPGGRVVVLEFGQAEGIMKWPYLFYQKYVMPTIGGWLSGNRDAYVYLPETSKAFPAGDAFLTIMRKTNSFSEVSFKKLNSGIAYVYTGIVGD
jgi:demethylmenaquinone methyltransferase/2-methoxy-6-polyprenyl-1,4-benzoquinol methylase